MAKDRVILGQNQYQKLILATRRLPGIQETVCVSGTVPWSGRPPGPGCPLPPVAEPSQAVLRKTSASSTSGVAPVQWTGFGLSLKRQKPCPPSGDMESPQSTTE